MASYEQKYLKYKNKYLKYKNIKMRGGGDPVVVPNLELDIQKKLRNIQNIFTEEELEKIQSTLQDMTHTIYLIVLQLLLDIISKWKNHTKTLSDDDYHDFMRPTNSKYVQDIQNYITDVNIPGMPYIIRYIYIPYKHGENVYSGIASILFLHETDAEAMITEIGKIANTQNVAIDTTILEFLDNLGLIENFNYTNPTVPILNKSTRITLIHYSKETRILYQNVIIPMDKKEILNSLKDRILKLNKSFPNKEIMDNIITYMKVCDEKYKPNIPQ